MDWKKTHKVWIMVYAALLVAGALLFTLNLPYAEYIFAAGALLAIAQTFTFALQHKTDDRQEARLQRLHFIASLFLGVAAWFMFVGSTSWVPMVLVYAVVAFYLTFRTKEHD